MRIKTYNKAAAFWRHGKHASIIGQVRQQEREKIKHKPEMYPTIQEALRAARKK